MFHIRVFINHTKVETLFDSGSQENLISESLVKKLGLEVKPHPKPYPLGWIHDKVKLNVTKKCKVKFVISSKLVGEVELDVIPLDICGIVLGSSYLYDRKAFFFRHENKYQITKYGVEYIIRAHQTKVSSSLVSARQMKRLVNSSKGCLLMVVREKYAKTSDAFQGCDSAHKHEFCEFIYNYDELFQEPIGLPLKQEIQHEIHLQHDAPLTNIGMYKMSSIEIEEIKK